MKETIKYITQSVFLGVIIIYVFNILGQYVNLNIPLNVLNIILVGILRVPGIILIIIILKI